MSALQLSLFIISNIFLVRNLNITLFIFNIVGFFILNIFFVFKRRTAFSMISKEDLKEINDHNGKILKEEE